MKKEKKLSSPLPCFLQSRFLGVSFQEANFLFFGNSLSSSFHYKQISINKGVIFRAARESLLCYSRYEFTVDLKNFRTF